MMFEVYRCGRSRRYPPLRPKCVKQVLNTALWDQHVLAASGAREPGKEREPLAPVAHSNISCTPRKYREIWDCSPVAPNGLVDLRRQYPRTRPCLKQFKRPFAV